MKRSEFSDMDSISKNRKLGESCCGKGAVEVDTFHDKAKHKYYQVQIESQGEFFRSTEPYESEYDIMDFGVWEKLSLD